MPQNINRVIITGNLTRDPELRSSTSGVAICRLRVAVNSRAKENGDWVDKPNYFDVTVFGTQGENVSKYLAKGRPVAIDGRLEWREWDQDGQKRQAVGIIADSVQFLSDGQQRDNAAYDDAERATAPGPVSSGDFVNDPPPDDDDIPF